MLLLLQVVNEDFSNKLLAFIFDPTPFRMIVNFFSTPFLLEYRNTDFVPHFIQLLLFMLSYQRKSLVKEAALIVQLTFDFVQFLSLIQNFLDTQAALV
jgi:hypothetical protein